MKKNKKYHPFVLIFIGLLSLSAFYFSVNDILLILCGNQAQGTVTDWRENSGGYRKAGSDYAVDVSYVDSNNIAHTFTQHDSIKTNQYVVGETVIVYYDLDNPEDAIISASFVYPLLSLGVFIWTVVMGLKMFLRKRKI